MTLNVFSTRTSKSSTRVRAYDYINKYFAAAAFATTTSSYAVETRTCTLFTRDVKRQVHEEAPLVFVRRLLHLFISSSNLSRFELK